MNTRKIKVNVKNIEQRINWLRENMESFDEQEDYLHNNYLTMDSKKSEVTLFKGFVEHDMIKIVYIHEKIPFSINEVVIFDGMIKDTVIEGVTYLKKVQYIKEIPAPGLLIFSTLLILFLCMGWMQFTDLVMYIVCLLSIIIIDRYLVLKKGTKEIKKYIQKVDNES